MVSDKLTGMMNEFKTVCGSAPRDTTQVVKCCKKILDYLCIPGNNTNKNCRYVDYFVCIDMESVDFSYLPIKLQEIIQDMGSALHDTHTFPDIAKNFESTPEQLLSRLQKIQLSTY